MLFLHGNAENISTHFFNVAWMPAEGFNVLALDYRGYGASAGSPSLPGVQLDIDAALSALLARPDVDPRRIVLFGQSLGGALAIHYAARGAHRGALRAVISDSAFADYRLIVSEKLASFFLTWPFQWLPALTVDNDYSPLAFDRRGEPAAAGADPRRGATRSSRRIMRSASTKRRGAEGALAGARARAYPVGARPGAAAAAQRLPAPRSGMMLR